MRRRTLESSRTIITEKIKIYPTEEQKEFLKNSFNASRFIYNKCLEYISKDYIIDTDNLNYKALNRVQYKDIKKYPTRLRTEYPHITKTISGLSINPIIEQLIGAIKKTIETKGILKFRKKKNNFSSISFENKGERSLRYKNEDNNYFIYANRLGYCKLQRKLRWNLSLDDKRLRRVHIKKEFDGYYAFIVLEIDISDLETFNKTDKTIALDWGLKTYFTGWDGNKKIIFDLDNKVLTNYNENIKTIKRKMDKCQYNSLNYKKYKFKLNKLCDKKTKYIEDSIYKQVKYIHKNYDNVILENIDSSIYRKNDIYVKEELTNKPFYKFLERLFHKLKLSNKKVFLIPSFYPSTQMCSHCGNILQGKDKLTLNDRVYHCKECGFEEDRDINAAKNIFNCKELEEFIIK